MIRFLLLGAPGLVLLIISIFRLRIDGLTILAVVLLVVWLWSAGVFARRFWADPEVDEQCARIDREWTSLEDEARHQHRR